ncbi:MAG: glycosyltransferase family 2 protein, partial [Aristaeellaceae bacterium]
IDVLLAVYNGERFLPPLLESLAGQDDAAFTVLMQDDGSTDGSTALLAAMADKDARFRPAEEGGRHLGAKGNFISLIRQATGDYAALCDQDDVWEANRLSRCRQALEQAEARWGADTPLLVHSDCRLVDAQGALLQESFFRHQGWDPGAVTLPRLLVQNNVTGCTLMMNAALRRLVAERADPAAMHMHDWFIALTAAAFGHIVFLDEPLVRYRQHGVNVMGASRQTLLQRGVKALGAWRKGKDRIALTYRHTRAFREAYGALLPEDAAAVIDRYLATEAMGKVRRVMAVRRGGYTMQSPVTRMGQLLFG